MRGAVEERAVELGEYIVANNATVRAAAGKFHISKSTVHTDVPKRNGWCGRQHKRPKTAILAKIPRLKLEDHQF